MSGLYKTEIETTLDEMLAYNMNEASNGTNRFKNVLFIGASGVGKTAIVLKWLQRANDNLGVNCCGESFYRTHTVSADNLKLLEDATDGRPNTILFIDEFDAAPKTCRDTLTDIIDNHTYVVDGVEKHLDGLLFVIATARPAYADYSDGHGIPHIVLPDIDPKNYPIEGSEQERFNTVHVYNDKRSCLEDIERRLDGTIKHDH
ncbi:MAG: ATP-binding protein [Clostridia bacterium]|nr:ATP-binding protein [Clostridia bacterium]